MTAITEVYSRFRGFSLPLRKVVGWIAIAGVIAFLAWLVGKAGFYGGWDWALAIKPAAIQMLSGDSPYQEPMFYSPPWALFPLLPLTFLPDSLAGFLLTFANMIALALISYRFKASPLAMALILISPAALHLYRNGNIDGVAALGVLMTPNIGLFFVMAKPQIGIGVALFWAIGAYRKDGLSAVLRTFAPVTVATLLSFAVYGFWPLQSAGVHAMDSKWNLSLFPIGIFAGLSLLIYAIKNKQIGLSLGASPFFSPYVASYSWSIAPLGIASNTRLVIIVVSLMWILQIVGVPFY